MITDNEGEDAILASIMEWAQKHRGNKTAEVHPTSRFDEDLDIDRVDVVDIAVDLEEEYHRVGLSDEAMEALYTPRDLARALASCEYKARRGLLD